MIVFPLLDPAPLSRDSCSRQDLKYLIGTTAVANLVDLRTEEGRGREAPRRASHREESEARLWLVMDLKENFF